METEGSDGERRNTAVKKDKRWAERWERGREEGHEPGGATHAGGRTVATAVALPLRICGFDYDDQWSCRILPGFKIFSFPNFLLHVRPLTIRILHIWTQRLVKINTPLF